MIDKVYRGTEMKSIFFTLAAIEIISAILLPGCTRIPSAMHLDLDVSIGDEKPT